MTSATPYRSDSTPEESIPLRILVQLIVFWGIAAVDEVAGTDNSVWAIPLSLSLIHI